MKRCRGCGRMSLLREFTREPDGSCGICFYCYCADPANWPEWMGPSHEEAFSLCR